MVDFLVKNAFALILFCGTILIGYGYYKSKIEDLIESGEKVDDMVNRLVDLEKFQAVQDNTNSHNVKKWDELTDWLKSLEKKLDEALKR